MMEKGGKGEGKGRREGGREEEEEEEGGLHVSTFGRECSVAWYF
jgi:hypothetical protein